MKKIDKFSLNSLIEDGLQKKDLILVKGGATSGFNINCGSSCNNACPTNNCKCSSSK